MMTQTTAPRTLKEKQRQERKALILQAAEEVLMEKGYHETSIDEIAARVGIAKGTVYLHFASKEDLVIALFAQDLEKFQQLVGSTVASELTARAKMEAILHVLYGSFFSKRFQLLYSLSNSADLRRIFVEKKGCMREMWEQISALITILLEEGKAAGEFDTTIPTSVMLSAFFSLLSPKSYDRLMIEGQMSQEEVSRQLGRIYFKGIAAIDT
jgi:TetR/AcrR family fatty acid metabolism transcriptional regulator